MSSEMRKEGGVLQGGKEGKQRGREKTEVNNELEMRQGEQETRLNG